MHPITGAVLFLGCQDGPSSKWNCCQSGPTITSNNRSGPYLGCQDGSFQKEIAAETGQQHSTTLLSPAEAVKTDPSKKKCWLKRSSTTFITEAGPYLLQKLCSKRAPTKNKNKKHGWCQSGPHCQSRSHRQSGPRRQCGPSRHFGGGGGSADTFDPLVALLHDLVWEIISASEKRMKNCIVKILDNVFEKMTKVGYFL